MERKIVRASVREIAEFSMKKGSLEKGRSMARMEDVLDGTKCHIEFQKQMADQYGADAFVSESFQRLELSNDEITLVISGRADGLLFIDDSIYIYEIKSISREVDTIHEAEFPV
ncbi:MAG TPA: hypothetical protein P5315_08875, partial [Clostridia bacterium]|nr:hypothetical protein [Clostridia bacterium]